MSLLALQMQASAEKGALLGYMPTVYLEVVMDVLHTLCKVRVACVLCLHICFAHE